MLMCLCFIGTGEGQDVGKEETGRLEKSHKMTDEKREERLLFCCSCL